MARADFPQVLTNGVFFPCVLPPGVFCSEEVPNVNAAYTAYEIALRHCHITDATFIATQARAWAGILVDGSTATARVPAIRKAATTWVEAEQWYREDNDVFLLADVPCVSLVQNGWDAYLGIVRP
jgi:hypothetical protein